MTKLELEHLALHYAVQYEHEPWFIEADVESDDHGPHLAVWVKKGLVRPRIKPPTNEVKVCIYLVDPE